MKRRRHERYKNSENFQRQLKLVMGLQMFMEGLTGKPFSVIIEEAQKLPDDVEPGDIIGGEIKNDQ